MYFLIAKSNIRLTLNINTILSVTFKFNSYKLVIINYNKIFKLIVFHRSFLMRTIIKKVVEIQLLQIRTLYENISGIECNHFCLGSQNKYSNAAV